MNEATHNPDVSADPQLVRRALSRFTTGVTVITAVSQDGSPIGFTANSFNSLSLEPPLILWSLSHQSGRLKEYRAASSYAVNILSADQADLAKRFSSKQGNRFDGLDWALSEAGAPVIANCLAVFECTHEVTHQAGDHDLFIGRVRRCAYTEGAPLTFFGGAFGSVTAPSARNPEGGFYEDYVLYLLARASNAASEEFHAQLAAEGMAAPVWRVLAVLSSGPATVGELARAVLYKQPTLTKLLNRMEKEGLLVRSQDSPDRRQVTVRLSKDGEATVRRLIPRALEHESHILSSYSEDEVATLRHVLKAFIRRTERQAGVLALQSE